jgi:hypothetical protein
LRPGLSRPVAGVPKHLAPQNRDLEFEGNDVEKHEHFSIFFTDPFHSAAQDDMAMDLRSFF